MKFLLDVCCSSRSLHALLSSLGHDVRLVGDDNPFASDEAVLTQAFQDRRIVLTTDKDFGELVFVQRRPHAGIVRFLDMPVAEQAAAMEEVLTHYQTDLHAGAMIVVTRGRVRIRR